MYMLNATDFLWEALLYFSDVFLKNDITPFSMPAVDVELHNFGTIFYRNISDKGGVTLLS